MTSVIVDPKCSDDERRSALYPGDIFVHMHSPAIGAFGAFTRGMIDDAFGGRDPETAQHDMDVNEYAAVLGALKPAFIHHPESKPHLRTVLTEHGCDLELTFVDVPRLRTSTSDNYLTTGVAYAFHPHRDTWYSPPMMQLNWWLSIFDVTPDDVVAFHPQYFDVGIANGGARYNYYAWNRDSRTIAAAQVDVDTREQQTGGADRSAPADQAGAPRRRCDGVLGGPVALVGPEHLRQDPDQRRLPRRTPSRRGGRPRRRQRRLPVHGDDAARLPPSLRPSSGCRPT